MSKEKYLDHKVECSPEVEALEKAIKSKKLNKRNAAQEVLKSKDSPTKPSMSGKK